MKRQSSVWFLVAVLVLMIPAHLEASNKKVSEQLRAYTYLWYKKCLGLMTGEAQQAERWLCGRAQHHVNNHNPYKDQQARVRLGVETSIQEKKFISQRSEITLAALKKFLGDDSLTVRTMPRVAVAVSGGGFRSTVSSLGSFQGLNDIGLLDGVLMAAGVSGGAWLVGPWVYGKMTLDEFKKTIPLSLDHMVESLGVDIIHASLLTKKIFGQPVSIIDLYGALLSRTLLKKFGAHCNSVRISQCQVDPATHPYPIFSAIEPLSPWSVDFCKGYRWYEVTPYEVGTDDLSLGKRGAFVPVWAHGRAFKDGVSVDHGPEQLLGYYLAVCGSAFEFAVRDIMPKLAADLMRVEQDLLDELPDLIELAPATLKHLLPSTDTFKKDLRKTFNWMIDHRRSPAQFNAIVPRILNKYTTLVDAGVACNIPLHPLLRKERDIDVLLVFDATSPIADADQLQLACYFAQSRGYTLPKIDFHAAGNSVITVFDDADKSKPVIVYMPLLNNPAYSAFDVVKCEHEEYCATFNLHYTHEQVDALSKLTRFTVNQQGHALKDLLKKVVKRKKGITA